MSYVCIHVPLNFWNLDTRALSVLKLTKEARVQVPCAT